MVFSDPILFSLFLFLCSTFPVFYFLSFPSVFLCTSSTFSFSFSLFLCITSTFFLAAFYLFPLTLPLFILCLSSIMFPLLFSLTFCAFVFFLLSFLSACSYFLYLLSLILFSAFSAYFSTFFFLFYFSYCVLFSTLFNYLVLILGFNYCNFSLFIFSVNLLSLLSPIILLFSLLSVNFLAFSHSSTCSVVSSDFLHNGHLVSVLSLL